jgi:hypothetical protein
MFGKKLIAAREKQKIIKHWRFLRMKKVTAILAAVSAVMFFGAAAFAGTIMINNETGFELHEIYISDSGADNWEEDVLGDNILGVGNALRLNVNGSFEQFDMRAVDAEGNTCDWFELPGGASQIAIYANGTAEYK